MGGGGVWSNVDTYIGIIAVVKSINLFNLG